MIEIKNNQKLKDAAFAAGAIIFVLIFRLWAIPVCLSFFIKQRKKFLRFCDIYDDPDMKKHSPKVMFASLIKYLAVIFIITVIITAQYGVAMILAPLLLAAFVMSLHIAQYIKLWQYHGYSVPVLMCLSGAAAVLAVVMSPIAHAIMWAAVVYFVS